MYNYEQIFDAENGHNLVLTLDANVQMSLENGLESMLKNTVPKTAAPASLWM